MKADNPTDLAKKIKAVLPDVPKEYVKTKDGCRVFVSAIFDEVERLHGEDAARKIFAPYGRQLTAHDKTRDDDAWLLFHYYQMPKRNKHELARALVKERRKPTIEAALRWIKLLTSPRGKRARAAHERYERLCRKLENQTLRLMLQFEEEHAGTDNS